MESKRAQPVGHLRSLLGAKERVLGLLGWNSYGTDEAQNVGTLSRGSASPRATRASSSSKNPRLPRGDHGRIEHASAVVPRQEQHADGGDVAGVGADLLMVVVT